MAELYGISTTSVYRALKDFLKPQVVHRVDHGKPRALPKSELEWYCELVAALKLRTTNKQGQIPKQGERRERELQELVKQGKRSVALFVDEAHDLNGHTLIGLKRLMEVVKDGGGRLSLILAGHCLAARRLYRTQDRI